MFPATVIWVLIPFITISSIPGQSCQPLVILSVGSRIYLLQRTTLTNTTVELARGYLEQALAWLKDDGVVSRIAINVQRRGNDILTAEITLYRNDGSSQLITFDDLWSALNG